MSFVFPQKWIAPAIAAAALQFGPPLNSSQDAHVQVKYRNLPGEALGGYRYWDTILIDRKPRREWPKWRAQCVLVHEYGHLAGEGHAKRRTSIMHRLLVRRTCDRWRRTHGLS